MKGQVPVRRVDYFCESSPTPPRIVATVCEACGCTSGKVADKKPAACQFCGAMPRQWWQAAYDCAPKRRQRRAAR